MINTRRRLNEVSQFVHTDPLTRIGNRRHIEGRLHAAIAGFENNQNQAGLLFVDIDQFKADGLMYRSKQARRNRVTIG